MDNNRNNLKPKGDQLVKRIPDREQVDIYGEIWKGKTQGDPAIEFHYYKVVRDYQMGKRRIVTDKMRPEHEDARKRAGELASKEVLKLDGKVAA